MDWGLASTSCGDRSLVKSQISLKSMMKSFAKEDQGILIELSVVDVTDQRRQDSKEGSGMPIGVCEVLQKFSVVFEPLGTLP